MKFSNSATLLGSVFLGAGLAWTLSNDFAVADDFGAESIEHRGNYISDGMALPVELVEEQSPTLRIPIKGDAPGEKEAIAILNRDLIDESAPTPASSDPANESSAEGKKSEKRSS